jgi:chromosome partitioning protein
MEAGFLSFKKISQLFELEGPWKIEEMIQGSPELSALVQRDTKGNGGFPASKLTFIGKTLFQKQENSGSRQAKVITLFTTKGGVLKSTLSFNLARMAALEGNKVLVLGLDIQGDISNAFGVGHYLEDDLSLVEVDQMLSQIKGLGEYFFGNQKLQDLIVSTDLEGLDCIPEVPELALIPEHLAMRHRREYWLKEQVIQKLRDQYDIIILDCSPNWTTLTTNALVATDILISPIETKVNNFRNFQVFYGLLQKFNGEMSLNYPQYFIGTKHQSQRKLAREIKDWYESRLSQQFIGCIRESSIGEEAMAVGMSLVEYRADCPLADDYRQVWKQIKNSLQTRDDQNMVAIPGKGADNLVCPATQTFS